MGRNNKITKSIFSDSIIGVMASWLIILVLSGFNLVALLSVTFKLPSTPLAMGYRASYLALALLLLIITFIRHPRFALTKGNYFFLVFWLIYITRLVYDLSIEPIPLYRNLDASYFYLYALGGCFIPSLAIAFTGKYINLYHLVKYLYYLLLINNILLFTHIFAMTESIWEIFSARTILRAQNENERALGPLMISLNGALLFSLSVVGFFLRKQFSFIHFNIILLGLMLGIGSVFLGASRGPLAFSVLALLFMTYYHIKHTQKTLTFYTKYFFGTTFFVLLFSFVIIPRIDWASVNMISRFLSTFSRSRVEQRDALYPISWNDFLENPILGKHFLILYQGEGGIVHNTYIEVLQSTGLLGGMFFYAMMAMLLHRMYKSFQFYSILIYIPALSIIVLGFAMTSGAIFSDPYFWILITFMLSLKKINFLPPQAVAAKKINNVWNTR